MPARPIYPIDTFVGPWAWNTKNFNRRIVKGSPDECHAWTGSTGPNGPLFGAQLFDEETKKYHPQMTQARRILYFEHTGEYLQNRAGVYHTCRNKDCMNPKHLSTQRIKKDKNV